MPVFLENGVKLLKNLQKNKYSPPFQPFKKNHVLHLIITQTSMQREPLRMYPTK